MFSLFASLPLSPFPRSTLPKAALSRGLLRIPRSETPGTALVDDLRPRRCGRVSGGEFETNDLRVCDSLTEERPARVCRRGPGRAIAVPAADKANFGPVCCAPCVVLGGFSCVFYGGSHFRFKALFHRDITFTHIHGLFSASFEKHSFRTKSVIGTKGSN